MTARYRVSWDMPPMGDPSKPYHRTEKEHESLVEAADQYFVLKEWEANNSEPIRNVKLEKATVEWKETFVPQWMIDSFTENGRVNARND